MDRILPLMQSYDVVTAHWYTDGPDLTTYIANIATRAGGRQVWLTETGYATCDDWTQAQVFYYNILPNFENSQASKIFVYVLRNGSNCSEAIVRADWSNREAFYQYRGWIFGRTVSSLTVNIQAMNGQYVVAENNGGGVVNANRDVPGPWETFTLDDRNGGQLESGDLVNIPTSDWWYFQAQNGGGGGLYATGGSDRDWETFRIVKLNGGGPIGSGDQVAFQSFYGYYMVAEGGGGDIVNANRPAIGPWETFTIWIR